MKILETKRLILEGMEEGWFDELADLLANVFSLMYKEIMSRGEGSPSLQPLEDSGLPLPPLC